MVRIKIFRGEDEAITGFVADGHADFADHGFDVVCAAVSVLATVTVLGLQARLKLSPDVKIDEERGYLECHLDRTIPPDLWRRAQDLLETMALGLRDIACEHSQYVQLEEVVR